MKSYNINFKSYLGDEYLIAKNGNISQIRKRLSKILLKVKKKGYNIKKLSYSEWELESSSCRNGYSLTKYDGVLSVESE